MKSAPLPESSRPLATGIRSRVRGSCCAGSLQAAGGTSTPMRQIKEAPDLSEVCRVREDEDEAPNLGLAEDERDICAMLAASYDLAMQKSQTDLFTNPDEVPMLLKMVSPRSILTLEDDGESSMTRCAEQEIPASSSSAIKCPRSPRHVTRDESVGAQSPKSDSDTVQESRQTSPTADPCSTEKSAELRSASGSPHKSRTIVVTPERCAARAAARKRSRERATPSSELLRPALLKETPKPCREQNEKLVSTTIQEEALSPATSSDPRRSRHQNLQQTRSSKQRPQPNIGKKEVVSPPRYMQQTQSSSLMRPGRHSVPASLAAKERYQERSASPRRRNCEKLGPAASMGQLPCEQVSVDEQVHSSSPVPSKHTHNVSGVIPQQIISPKRPCPPTPTIEKEQVSSPPLATERTPPRSAGRQRKLAGVGSSAAKQVAAVATSAKASPIQQSPPTQLHTQSKATRAPSPAKRSNNTVPMVVARLEELTSESQSLHWPLQLPLWPFQALPSSAPDEQSTLGAPLPPSTWTSLGAGAPTSPQQTSTSCPASAADTAATAAVVTTVRAVDNDDEVDAKTTSTECLGLCGTKGSSTAQSARVLVTRSRSLPQNSGVQVQRLLTPPHPGLARSTSMCAAAVSSSAQTHVCPKTETYSMNTQSLVHHSDGREGTATAQTQQRKPLRAYDQQFHRHQQEPVTQLTQREQPVQFQMQSCPRVQTARCHPQQAPYATVQPTRSVHMQPPPPARSTACGREPSNQSVEEGSRPTTPRLCESNAGQKLCTARSLSPGYGLIAGGALSSSTPPCTPPRSASQGATNGNCLNLQDFASPLTPPSPVHSAPCGNQRSDVERNSSVAAAAAAWAAAGQIIQKKQLRSDGGTVRQQCIASSSPRSASSPKVTTSTVHSPGLGGLVPDDFSRSVHTPRVLCPEARMGGFLADSPSCPASPPGVQLPKNKRMGGFVPDQLDRMDKAVEELLRHLDETTAERLAVRKVAPGQYLIAGRRVLLQWGRGGSISGMSVGTSDLLVFEQEAPGFIGDGVDLPVYISQAANVSASLCGTDEGASAVGRIPQELRLTFQDGDHPKHGGVDSMLPHVRRELMEKAVQEASLRRNAAEQTERKLSPCDYTSKRRQLRTALPTDL